VNNAVAFDIIGHSRGVAARRTPMIPQRMIEPDRLHTSWLHTLGLCNPRLYQYGKVQPVGSADRRALPPGWGVEGGGLSWRTQPPQPRPLRQWKFWSDQKQTF